MTAARTAGSARKVTGTRASVKHRTAAQP